MRKRVVLIVLVVLAAGGYYAGWVARPPGPTTGRAFDPDRLAALEIDMWQAYYDKERLRLFRGLVVSLHEQYRYPWVKAARVAFYLARAASRFSDLRADYDQVLPDLERAYRITKAWTGAAFDPSAIARAELAWWVARRVPGQDSPEQVGALIAEENAMLYGVSPDRVLEASILRARAGRLRDEGGGQADWGAVSSLLRDSYRALKVAVN